MLNKLCLESDGSTLAAVVMTAAGIMLLISSVNKDLTSWRILYELWLCIE